MIKSVQSPQINSAQVDSAQKKSTELVDKRDPKVLEAAKMYEQVFLKEMVDAMRKAVPKSDLMEESMGEKIYKDKMYENYVDQWSKTGGVGLSDVIYNQIMEKYGPQQHHEKPKGAIPLEKPKPIALDQKTVAAAYKDQQKK